MAVTHHGGVLLFGGINYDNDNTPEDRILEFRNFEIGWTILENITLQKGRSEHIVFPIM